MATRVAVTTGAPATAAAFAPTLPTHAAGDRLVLVVTGKYETTTTPTIDQGWTLIVMGTPGTGTTGNDTGICFIAVYAKDATSGAETAPTVTPGATAPNSWEWVCVSHRPGTGKIWKDAIAASAPWVAIASDASTASPLSAAATTSFATAGDAIFCVGVIPTDLGSALTAGATLTATGLSGGTLDNTTTNYVENALGQDTAAAWMGWVGFTGTQSANLSASMTITGASNHSGGFALIVLREDAITGTLVITEGPDSMSASGTVIVAVTGTMAITNAGDTMAAAGAEVFTGTMAVSEAADTMAATGAEVFTGTLTGSEGHDSMSASGTVGDVVTPVTGTMTASESRDTMMAVGVTAPPTFTFTPPTHEEPMRRPVGWTELPSPLPYFRLTYAASVLRVNGVFRSVRTPSAEMVAAAGIEGRDYFRGGGIYPNIDPAIAAELQAAGYTVEVH